MQVVQVTTRSDLDKFIRFPYAFYKDDPVWVPPLLTESHGQFSKEKNPLLEHCEYALFLLKDNNQIAGRIAAFLDTLAIDFWKEPVGLFGYYECPDNEEGAKMLLNTASAWLKKKGMKYMRGPWSFVSQEWGLVVEGFTPQPVIMAPYNPPYYIQQFENYGLHKVKDLLCYYISGKEGYKIPDRILNYTDAIEKRYGIKVRRVNLKNYDQEVRTIIDLSNRSLIDNWGYAPVTDAEAEAMARDLKPVIQSKGVLFAENIHGKAVGFVIAIPDVNMLIKKLNGHLLPFGWIKILFGLPRLNHYRLFALGVVPEYQGKGIDSLLYRALHQSLYNDNLWLEINYILEDNYPVRNAILKLDAKPLRRYRVYQKEI